MPLKPLQPSAQDGMKVATDTERVREVRKLVKSAATRCPNLQKIKDTAAEVGVTAVFRGSAWRMTLHFMRAGVRTCAEVVATLRWIAEAASR